MGERQRVLETYAVPEKSAKVSKPPEQTATINQYGQITRRVLDPGFLINRVTSDWYLPRLRSEVEWKLGFLTVIADQDEDAKQHFDNALAQDTLLQRAAELENDETVFVRATIGEALVRNAEWDKTRYADTPRLYAIALKYPRAPATPYLLWHCAVITKGDPVGWREIFDKLIKEYPHSHHALEARYNEILRLDYEDHDTRRAMTAQFHKDYPNEKGYHEYLYWWDQNLMESLADRERRWAEQRKREALEGQRE